jgi:hypothetical protein
LLGVSQMGVLGTEEFGPAAEVACGKDLGHWRRGSAGDRVAGAIEQKNGPARVLDQERCNLLQRDPAEAGAKRAAPNAAEEVPILGFEGFRNERLTIVAGETQLRRLQPLGLDGQPESLDDERRVVRLKPVVLFLADDEMAAIRRDLHRTKKEPEHEGIDDLGAVVEDATVTIDDVVVLPHGRRV